MKLHSVKLRKDEHHDTLRKLDGTSIEHMVVHYIYCEKWSQVILIVQLLL